MQHKKYRTIFISDVHLGTKHCKADYLCEFLKYNNCERLYLIGDIIDGWKLHKRIYWPQSHSNVIRRVLTKAKRKTRIYYIIGNHDEVLRKWISNYQLKFGKIRIRNEYVHEGADGKQYLITHGDQFDGVTRLAPWIAWTGDHAYHVVLNINTWYNRIRKWMGLKYWSMSKFLKHNVKKAVDFVFEFEKNLAKYCKAKGYDGVICGHIHTPEIKKINGITYMNDGDWVESCTALVEHHDGRFELVYWKDIDHESDKTYDDKKDIVNN